MRVSPIVLPGSSVVISLSTTTAALVVALLLHGITDENEARATLQAAGSRPSRN